MAVAPSVGSRMASRQAKGVGKMNADLGDLDEVMNTNEKKSSNQASSSVAALGSKSTTATNRGLAGRPPAVPTTSSNGRKSIDPSTPNSAISRMKMESERSKLILEK